MFKVNEGPTDRIARAIVGVVFLFLAINLDGGLQIFLFVLAAICLITAVTGFCAIYSLLKCNTMPKEAKIVTMPSTATEKPTEEPSKEETKEEADEEVEEEITAEESEAEEEIKNPMNVMTDPETDEAPAGEAEEKTSTEEADEEQKNDEEEPIKL